MSEELRFEGRTAVVTGGGRGLGREYALLLAQRGANVVVNDLGTALTGTDGKTEPVARSVVREIADLGGNAVADQHDISTTEGGSALVDTAIESFGKVDIVVNNAGIIRDRSVHNMTPEEFDSVIAVHLRGAFCVTQPAFAHMREQGYGRIVVTSSAAGIYGTFGQLNYATAKGGLIAFAKTLAHEGARHGIHANAIAPGAHTRMTDAVIGDARDAMRPELVAPVVGWLCHESCQLSGEVIVAFAGRVAAARVLETRGYYSSDLTLEDIARHAEQITKGEAAEFPDAAASMELRPDGVPFASAGEE